MEQLKNNLGPFELFAAIIGGSPFVLAGILLYNPVKTLAELVPLIQKSGSLPIALTILFLSYIIGSTVQDLGWRYFLSLCRLFKEDYFYYGDQLIKRNQLLQQPVSSDVSHLEFEDKLVLQLREYIGIPNNLDWMNGRLTAYLRECKSPSVATVERFIASHIMHRSLSLGCLVLCMVSIINTVRLGSLASLAIVPILLYCAYLMFFQALSFQRWQNRELLLGFYFASTKEQSQEGNR
ncbi:MAG: hypothetical protein AAF959_30030 [Cyanobacteria bacterium P01_D01_bin.56]